MPTTLAPFDRSGFDDSFLASPDEIFAVLTQFAGRRPSRRQVSRILLEEFLSHQPSAIVPTHVAALEKANLQKSAVVDTHQSAAPGQSRHDLSSGGRHRHCTCGTCQWCLDNARWDRVFAEKFADPGYYPLKVKHNSSLGV